MTSAEAEELTSSSPPDNEFISDAFQSQPIDEEALKKEMQQLGMADGQGTCTAVGSFVALYFRSSVRPFFVGLLQCDCHFTRIDIQLRLPASHLKVVDI